MLLLYMYVCCCIYIDAMISIAGDDDFEIPYGGMESIYEEGEIRTSQISTLSVQGRLRKNADFWLKELESSSFVKEIVTEGYRIPFIRLPEPVFYRNHKSSFEHSKFTEEAIQDLVAKNCVVQCMECPIVCSPLSVVVNARGKKRLVLDLRYVNQFILLTKFKYEGLNIIPQLFCKGDYFITFDLKSGYHHVDVHKDCWQYLGFSWGTGPARKWFAFRVLPFGLASACYVFTKLLRPLVKKWRSEGLRSIVYIDDGICAARSKFDCTAAKNMVLTDLDKAGFVLSIDKCVLDPVQRGEWLGFIIDLGSGSIFVPPDKIKRLQYSISSSLSDFVQARAIASIIGQIISMTLAIGPVARLRTRALYALVNRRKCWSDRLPMNGDAKQELLFWNKCLPVFNGREIWFDSGTTRVAYSDASSSGFGGYVVEIGPSVSHGQWSVEEVDMSSTWRELKAVFLVLLSFAEKLKGHAVKWFSDNQNVVRIVQVGSMKPHLQEGALCIFQTCMQYNIKLDMEWIPRSKNEVADYISRIVDVDDWHVNNSMFSIVDGQWGPHSVDRFASVYNTKLTRFNSKFWSPGTEAVDAFTVNWSNEVNWWVPPVHLIPRTIRHAQVCSAKGTLVFPAWKSAAFWPVVCPDGRHLAKCIHKCRYIPYSSDLIVAGRSGASIGDALTSDSVFIFAWIDFTVPPRAFNHGFCTFDFSGHCTNCSLVWPISSENTN